MLGVKPPGEEQPHIQRAEGLGQGVLVSAQHGEDVSAERLETFRDKTKPETVSAKEKVSKSGARSLGEKKAVLAGVSQL